MYLPENTISAHVFQRVGFPIVLYARSEWEQIQIKYLESNYKSGHFNTLVIAQWSQNHRIPYKIFYPRIRAIITNPTALKNYIYLKMKGY